MDLVLASELAEGFLHFQCFKGHLKFELSAAPLPLLVALSSTRAASILADLYFAGGLGFGTNHSRWTEFYFPGSSNHADLLDLGIRW